MTTGTFNAATIEYRNPVWASPANDLIEVEINHPDHGWILFGATAADCEAHGCDLYARIIADGASISAYVAPVAPVSPDSGN